MKLSSKGERVATIIRDAGGQIVGRTRLQKIAFILEAAGLGEGFNFQYKHYGPYSDELARASHAAVAVGLIYETREPASWGGTFSTYGILKSDSKSESPEVRRKIAEEATRADAIELELAATALFLAKQGVADPWTETAHRKPEKAAHGRLEQARELYVRLGKFKTPTPLPTVD